jgi:glutathione S-transferase
MVLKIYGMRASTFTQKVLCTLHELRVYDYEFNTVDVMTNDHKSEEFLKMQPFGLIPCINDDGLVLFESTAICRYLVQKYQTTENELIPTDLKAYGLFEQAAYVESSNYTPHVCAIAVECFFVPWKGGQTNQEKVKHHVEQLTKVLDIYEHILSKQTYIGGDKFTLADILHFPYTSLVIDRCGYGKLFEERPLVKEWWNKIYNRPSWQARAVIVTD